MSIKFRSRHKRLSTLKTFELIEGLLITPVSLGNLFRDVTHTQLLVLIHYYLKMTQNTFLPTIKNCYIVINNKVIILFNEWAINGHGIEREEKKYTYSDILFTLPLCSVHKKM